MRYRADVALMTACLALAACAPAPDDDATSAARDTATVVLPPAMVTALAEAERAELARLPAGAGHELVVGGCLTCHGVGLITQQHKDTAGWSKTVTQMVAWGAPVPDSARATLVTYLAEHYGAR